MTTPKYNIPQASKELRVGRGDIIGLTVRLTGMDPSTPYVVEPVSIDVHASNSISSLVGDLSSNVTDYTLTTDVLGRAMFDSRPPLYMTQGVPVDTSTTTPADREVVVRDLLGEGHTWGNFELSARVWSPDLSTLIADVNDPRVSSMSVTISTFTRVDIASDYQEITLKSVLNQDFGSPYLQADETENGFASYGGNDLYATNISISRLGRSGYELQSIVPNMEIEIESDGKGYADLGHLMDGAFFASTTLFPQDYQLSFDNPVTMARSTYTPTPTVRDDFTAIGGTNLIGRTPDGVHASNWLNAPGFAGSTPAYANVSGSVFRLNAADGTLGAYQPIAKVDAFARLKVYTANDDAGYGYLGLRWQENVPSGQASGLLAQFWANGSNEMWVTILAVDRAGTSHTILNGTGIPCDNSANVEIRFETNDTHMRLFFDDGEVWSDTQSFVNDAGGAYLFMGVGSNPSSDITFDFFEAGGITVGTTGTAGIPITLNSGSLLIANLRVVDPQWDTATGNVTGLTPDITYLVTVDGWTADGGATVNPFSGGSTSFSGPANSGGILSAFMNDVVSPSALPHNGDIPSDTIVQLFCRLLGDFSGRSIYENAGEFLSDNFVNPGM